MSLTVISSFLLLENLEITLEFIGDFLMSFFSSVNETLQALVFSSKIAVKEDRRLGLVAFLHTFGRDLKFNPHIHVLVAERTLDLNLNLRKFSYFHFEKLRLYFQLALLRNISNYLKVHASKDVYNRFNRLRSSLISKYKKGFYTHGPKT